MGGKNPNSTAEARNKSSDSATSEPRTCHCGAWGSAAGREAVGRVGGCLKHPPQVQFNLTSSSFIPFINQASASYFTWRKGAIQK